jgi:hypothetical protein
MVSSGFLVRTLADSDYNRGDVARSADAAQFDYFHVIDFDDNNLISKNEVLNFSIAFELEISAGAVDQLFLLCGGIGVQELNFTQFQCALGFAGSQGIFFLKLKIK